MPSFFGFQAALNNTLRQPENPSNKKPFMHQAQRVLSLSNRRYINAPIICTSKILNTVIDGKIIA